VLCSRCLRDVFDMTIGECVDDNFLITPCLSIERSIILHVLVDGFGQGRTDSLELLWLLAGAARCCLGGRFDLAAGAEVAFSFLALCDLVEDNLACLGWEQDVGQVLLDFLGGALGIVDESKELGHTAVEVVENGGCMIRCHAVNCCRHAERESSTRIVRILELALTALDNV
jgi:hypothetical protein